MTKITKETSIVESMNLNPNAAEILMDAGLGCIGCSMAQFETIEQGLMAHGFSNKEIDDIIEELNQ